MHSTGEVIIAWRIVELYRAGFAFEYSVSAHSVEKKDNVLHDSFAKLQAWVQHQVTESGRRVWAILFSSLVEEFRAERVLKDGRTRR